MDFNIIRIEQVELLFYEFDHLFIISGSEPQEVQARGQQGEVHFMREAMICWDEFPCKKEASL